MLPKSSLSTSRPSPITNPALSNVNQSIIDIDDSDEDVPVIPPVTRTSQASQVSSNDEARTRPTLSAAMQTPEKKKRLRMLIVEIDSDDDSCPKSVAEYESWDKRKRKTYRNQMARVAKDAFEEKDREKQSQQISSGSHADNGTVGLMANLNIDEDKGKHTLLLLLLCPN